MEEKPVSILLIEDNPDHVELIIRQLKDDGRLVNKIHIARDGKEALDFLFRREEYKDPEKSPRPGLILLDLRLPKIDGLDVLEKIKESPELKIIPVVVLTTSAQDADIARAYQRGVNSYITKPVKFEDFVRVIKEIKLYWILTNTGPEIG